MATIKEKYLSIKKAAQAYVRVVRNRSTFSGGYWESETHPNGPCLKQEVVTADLLGYETHLRVSGGKLTIYHVAKMPPAPWDVMYG